MYGALATRDARIGALAQSTDNNAVHALKLATEGSDYTTATRKADALAKLNVNEAALFIHTPSGSSRREVGFVWKISQQNHYWTTLASDVFTLG